MWSPHIFLLALPLVGLATTVESSNLLPGLDWSLLIIIFRIIPIVNCQTIANHHLANLSVVTGHYGISWPSAGKLPFLAAMRYPARSATNHGYSMATSQQGWGGRPWSRPRCRNPPPRCPKQHRRPKPPMGSATFVTRNGVDSAMDSIYPWKLRIILSINNAELWMIPIGLIKFDQ